MVTKAPKPQRSMGPDADAIFEPKVRFLTESNTNDKAVDLICSRCSIVQQESGSGEVCEQCNDSADTQLAQLTQNFGRAFSNLRDLGDGWWLFCDGPDWTFKAHVSYEGISFADRAVSTVCDLWLPADHAISPWEFRFSLQDFLQQFHSLPYRWGWQYEPLTESILHSSAQWQESYFMKSTLMPTHIHNEATVVAASLRCLAISSDIDHVSGNWLTRYFQNEDERYARLADVERSTRGPDREGIRPSVEVWRLGEDEELPDSIPQNRERLPQILWRTIQMAKRLLYRGRPRDWPSLFYVLCILLLVNGSIDAQFWTEATDRAARETKKALRELCNLFHLTTGNMQPLSSDFDIKRYAVLVDDNELAVRHYRRMHLMWMDNKYGEEDEEDADDLWENIDSFVHGVV